MTIERGVYVDRRPRWVGDHIEPSCEFERLTADGFPSVYIAPSDRPDEGCDIDEYRVSREALREWAEAILHTLGSS